ncbi:hypothetical protein GCM10007901_20480 [Dyella acidisoli]|uniref:Secretin/TonB short N-terminal domain-containing protein n=1 Tax=Dyella acidisoli TaxID=1867834 RepID=A0ABQ5XN31_9GAMM|nr:hypothetical protein GCM10007901_20480 [Dyella acidisoli]
MLAAQGQLQIMYSPELVHGLTSRAVVGRFTAEAALTQLLADSGLTWQMVGPSTLLLQRMEASTENVDAAKIKGGARAAKTLGTMTISGSLIDNPRIQTATPVYTLTAEVINARGFNSVAEALQYCIFATGSVQGPQHFAAFTQGAQTVNIGNLGPSLTLILMDGKPLAEFGMLYDGSYSFTNLSNIPLSLVDHIDIMPAGASSIYGSQAVAAVINIVTKQRMDGGQLSVQSGGYTAGGGASQRISAAYGHTFNALSILASIEFNSASPIWGYQRALTASTWSNPNGLATPSLQSAIVDYGSAASYTGQAKGFITPPSGCAGSLYGATTQLSTYNTSPGIYGQYCGSRYADGYATLSNRIRSIGGSFKLQYRVNEDLWLYADAMMSWQRQSWYAGAPLWASTYLPSRLIEDADTGNILVFERTFAPEEEPGGVVGQMSRQQDLLYQLDLGANGQFGASNWIWDIYYLRSGDRTTLIRNDLMTAPINAFFQRMFGPPVGIDPSTGLLTYHPDYAAFFRSITPAQFASFTQDIGEFSQTWINDTRATISNAEWFELPGGNAGFAALVERGGEAWYAPVDPLFSSGAVYLHTVDGGGGQRAHSAAAFEFNAPVWRQVTLDLSGRYDYYSPQAAASNHKFTYKLGIEYRPTDSLLLRGNYTTVFKAPDLPSIYLGPSAGFASVTDLYLCTVTHTSNCGTNATQVVPVTLLGSRKLQPLSAKTWTAGLVWSPNDSLSFGLDYFHIDAQDEIASQDPNLLVQEESQCLLGQRDPNSLACQVLTNPTNGQVQRASPDGRGEITGVTSYDANLAHETTESVVANVTWGFPLPRVGKFAMHFDYNDILKHDYQQSPGQPVVNLLDDPTLNVDFKSVVEGSMSWTSLDDRWSSTLYGRRLGSSPDYASISGLGYPGSAHLTPWITFNWSLTFTPASPLKFSLVIKNIANKGPPRDPTFTAFPYFNFDNYNDYGREIMLQMDLKLTSHPG